MEAAVRRLVDRRAKKSARPRAPYAQLPSSAGLRPWLMSTCTP